MREIMMLDLDAQPPLLNVRELFSSIAWTRMPKREIQGLALYYRDRGDAWSRRDPPPEVEETPLSVSVTLLAP